MPEYPLKSGKKIQYFFFSMNDAPKIGSEVEIDGKKWKRIIIEPPKAQIDSISKSNIDTPKDFADVTGKKNGTYGDLIDLSKELSEKRKEKFGTDKVKEKFEKEHKRRRRGRDSLRDPNELL